MISRRLTWLCLLICVTFGYTSVCSAHKPSDSYLTLEHDNDASTLRGQWDISLRDLDHAIGLDTNGDGAITWGELKARRAAVATYAFDRLRVEALAGSAREDCPLTPGQLLTDTHVDGGYAVMRFTAACPFNPAELSVHYTFLFDLDPNHRGLLNVITAGGAQAHVLSRDNPAATLNLKAPPRSQQLRSFAAEGLWHIWEGYDHILFLLTLLLPSVVLYRSRQWEARPSLRDSIFDVAKVVTAFTLAHSLTLSLAVNGFIHLPSRLVETAIATTVLLGAINNLFPLVGERRWLVAFVFGLIHGLGFASVLADLGLTGWNLTLALVGFNLGVELGQLAIVLVFVPIIYAGRETVFYRRVFMPVSAALIGAVALYWISVRAMGSSVL